MSPLWFCAFILIGTRMDYILRDVLSAQLHFFLQPSLHSSTPAYFLLASTAPFFFRLVYLDLYPFIFKMRRFIRVSHFGLTLIFLVTTLAKDVRVDNITWTSPADGDTYSPGDTIIGKWRTSKAVVSPSFRLCPSADQHVSNSSDDSDDGCGSTVWPMVRQSAGSYLISLAVPNVTSEAGFVLRMEDDFGKLTFSPVFTLRPTTTTENGPGSIPSEASGSLTSPSGAPFTPSSPINPSPVLGSPSHPKVNASAASVNVSPPTTTVTFNPNAHSVNPYVTMSRTPPPVAAFAVPLSLVGAILLVAGGLSFRHHRKLRNERALDAEKLDLSRCSSMNTFTSSSIRHDEEVKHALDVLAMRDIRYEPAVPTYLPVDIRREPRQSTRQAMSMYAATPAYARPLNMASATPLQPGTKPPANATRIATPEDDDINAGATHSVISNYLLPSPIPPPSLLSAPQQLHIRREVSLPTSNIYPYDKPLPHSPRYGPGCTVDVYDAVAQVVGRRIA